MDISKLVLVQCNESEPLADRLAKSSGCFAGDHALLVFVREKFSGEFFIIIILDWRIFPWPVWVSPPAFRTGPPCALQCTALICICAILKKILHCNAIAAVCITAIFKQALHFNIILAICINIQHADDLGVDLSLSLQAAWCDLGRCIREAFVGRDEVSLRFSFEVNSSFCQNVCELMTWKRENRMITCIYW